MKKPVLVIIIAALLFISSACASTTPDTTNGNQQIKPFIPTTSSGGATSKYTTPSVSTTGISTDVKGALWALAIKSVKSELKSPTTAKFPTSCASDGVAFSKEGNNYVLKTYVDAENSFGAAIRTYFTLKASCDGEKVTLVSLNFNDNYGSLLDFQETLDNIGDSIREENDSGNYTSKEEEIWQYCMDRWDYYDALEGGYAGDKYTDQVFKDAGNKFGITASEAERIWDKVDKAKLGLN